jgi:hypothetical protein
VSDIAEATYVLDKSDRSGCTVADLISFREEKTPATNFTSPSRDFCGYRSHQGLLSPIATRLHTEVEESHVSSQWSPNSQTNDDDIHFLGTDSKDEIRKTIISAMDQVLYSNRVPSHMIKKFEAETLREFREVGKRLVQYKTQLFQEMNNITHESIDMARNSSYEFACEQNAGGMSMMDRREKMA